MSSADLPEYYRPLVGYAMWYLSRGDDSNDVLNRMEQKAEWSSFSKSQLQAAIGEAQTNVDAMARANTAPETTTLQDAFLRFGGGTDIVGARVLYQLTSTAGIVAQGSVLVNTPDNLTALDVQQAVRDMIASGQIPTPDYFPGQVVAVDTQVIQLYGAGYGNAAVTL